MRSPRGAARLTRLSEWEREAGMRFAVGSEGKGEKMVFMFIGMEGSDLNCGTNLF